MKPLRRSHFVLNGRRFSNDRPTNTVLVDELREMGLVGTKVSCDQGVCGACTVLVDGNPTAACMTLLFTLDDATVQTIEHLTESGELDPVQQAFIDESAFQCGFCTAGMVMLTKALFAADRNPDEQTVRRWLSSNICRCTGYAPILRAVERARRMLNDIPIVDVHGH